MEKKTTATKTRQSSTIRHDSDTVAEAGGLRRFVLVVWTLFIGALSSGVWELLLRDSFEWFRLRVLDVFGLGISALYVGTYSKVATVEQPQILLIGNFFLMCFAFLVGFFTFGKLLVRTIYPRSARMAGLLLFLYILPCVWIFGQQARYAYIRDARLHYHLLLDTCAPFMDEHEHKLTKSKFSQVKSRADYDAVVGSLEEIARSNNQYFRPFARW